MIFPNRYVRDLGTAIAFDRSTEPLVMKHILTALCLSCGLSAAAQKDTLPPLPIHIDTLRSNDGSLTRVETSPRFPGGDAALVEYMTKELRYPDDMRQAGKQGVVHVAFTIADNGELRNVRVKQPISDAPALNEEALRVVGAMPRWEPATVRGVTVPMDYVLPVKFEVAK